MRLSLNPNYTGGRFFSNTGDNFRRDYNEVRGVIRRAIRYFVKIIIKGEELNRNKGLSFWKLEPP